MCSIHYSVNDCGDNDIAEYKKEKHWWVQGCGSRVRGWGEENVLFGGPSSDMGTVICGLISSYWQNKD